jgi:hypothetical protein
MKLVRLTPSKITLIETNPYREHLWDKFPPKAGPKQGYFLLSLDFFFAIGYAIRKVQKC